MEYREFGNTGIQVSEIGVGCGGLGGEKKLGLEPVVERALDLGINFFDTCDTYAEYRSEAVLGSVFRNQPRDRFVVCTKFGGVIDDQGWHRDISVPHLHEAFEASCRRLCVDYFDIYLVHTPPKDLLDHDDLIAELDKMVSAGKIRTYGVSTERGDFANEVVTRTAGRAIEISLNLFFQEPRKSFLPVAAKQGAGVICKSPMAGGVLTESFTIDGNPEADPRYQRFGHERFTRRAELLRAARSILTANGRTIAQGALAWLLSLDPPISTVIPGISSLQRLEETAAVAGARLSAEDMAALDALADGALAGTNVD